MIQIEIECAGWYIEVSRTRHLRHSLAKGSSPGDRSTETFRRGRTTRCIRSGERWIDGLMIRSAGPCWTGKLTLQPTRSRDTGLR